MDHCNNSKVLLVVLGMHRSGTSAVTRGLKELGIDLGNNLMPGIPGDNDKGFWEDLDFYHFNIELLKGLHQDWHTLSLIGDSIFKTRDLSEFKIKAIALIREKIRGARLFGIKDPRTARLLPFWKEIFGFLGLETRFVIMVRNPLSVADSLKKRDGFLYEKSYYLWLEHMAAAVIHTEDSPTVFVDYDNLVNDPSTQLKRIAQKLALPEPDYHSHDFNEYACNFIDKGFQHTQYNPADLALHASIPEALKTSYNLLHRAANDLIDWNSGDFYQFFHSLNRELISFKPAFLYADRLEKMISDQTETCREQADRLNRSAEDIQQKATTIKALSQSLDLKEQALSQVRSQLAQKEQELVRANGLLHQKERDFETDLSSLQAERDRLIQEIIARDDKISLCEAQLDQSAQFVQQIYASTSWRLTYPLRALKSFFVARSVRP